MDKADVVLRQQAYYQGYMDGLAFVIGLRSLSERAVPIPRPVREVR